MAGVLAEYFRAPLDAVYATAAGVWEDRTERVRRLIAEHSARERLASLTAPLTSTVVVNSCVRRGTPAQVILAHAGETRAGLIVLGAADRRRFGSGSHRLAATLASSASAAVWTVPSDARGCAVRRILVPVTSAEATRAAVDWAMSLARRFGATVSLACMEPPANWFGAGLFGQGRRARDLTRHRLGLSAKALARLQRAEITATEAAPQRDANSLALLAKDQAFDLVVVGIPVDAEVDTEQVVLAERLRQCSLVPALSVRARVQRSSYSRQLQLRPEFGAFRPDSAA
jgi:nucleotide-binding universal stress UspA family protein